MAHGKETEGVPRKISKRGAFSNLARPKRSGAALLPLVLSACLPAPKSDAPPLVVEAALPRPPQQEPLPASGDAIDSFERLAPFVLHRETNWASNLPASFGRSDVARWRIEWSRQADLKGFSRWLAIDHHAFRFVARAQGEQAQGEQAKKLRLTDLINEDEELAPGTHWLYMMEVGKKSASIQAHSFSVESPTDDKPIAPACLLWTNGLTFNGKDAAANVQIRVISLYDELKEVKYLVHGDNWQSTTTEKVGVPLKLVTPPNGDLDIEVECKGADGFLTKISRTITVNEDAQSPESSK